MPPAMRDWRGRRRCQDTSDADSRTFNASATCPSAAAPAAGSNRIVGARCLASISSGVAARTPRTVTCMRIARPASGWLPSSTTCDGVDLGDGVDGVLGHVGRDGAVGQAFELHADVHAVGEELAILEADELGAVLAERVLGFDLQLHVVAGGLAVQGLFDLGQQVVAAEEEFRGLGELVDRRVLGVRQLPGERDDARGGDVHWARFYVAAG